MSALGPVSLVVLEVIAAAPDGITALEAAQRLGRSPVSAHQAIGVLEARGCVTVLRRIRRAGPAVKVWGATAHGRAVLEAATQDCLAGRSATTPSDDGTRQVQDPASGPPVAGGGTPRPDRAPCGPGVAPSPSLSPASRAPAAAARDQAPRQAGSPTPLPDGAQEPAGRDADGADLPAGAKAMAAAMSETDLERSVRVMLKDLRLLAYHTHDSRRSAAGFPDWVICGKRVLFRELKKQNGIVTLSQRLWIDALDMAGCDADVWRPADLLSGRIARELAAAAGIRAAAGGAT